MRILKQLLNKKSLVITTCEKLTDFDYKIACAIELSTNAKVGAYSLKCTKNGEASGFLLVDVWKKFNFSTFKTFKYRFYSENKANIASVATVLFTANPYSYDNCYIYYAGVEIVNGWSVVSLPLTSFIKSGVGNLASIEGVRFVVNLLVNNETEVVHFDKVEVC